MTTFSVEVTPSLFGQQLDALGGPVTPQQKGAVSDGVTDDSAAFIATFVYLKSIAGNLSVNGFYKGSPKFFSPEGHNYLGTTPIDVTHSLTIEGEGGGRFMTQGGGITRWRWAHGSSGLRIQFPNTSGDSATGAYGLGAGGFVGRGFKLEGGYLATEGNYHGLVARVPVTLEDVYIYGWSGEGVQSIAAQSGAYSAYGGNTSVSCYKNVRFESNRTGLKNAGSDANVITVFNSEFISNRQFGYYDDSGIGANVLIATHAAGNGLVVGATPTQCTYSGNHYAAQRDQTSAAVTANAPSGTAADNTYWLYVEAGVVTSQFPTWDGIVVFRPGGDYATTNAPIVTLVSPYSEDTGFSQFGASTLVINPAIANRYMRGGVVIRALNSLFDVSTGAIIRGALQAYGSTTVLGPQAGTLDNTVNLDNTNNVSALVARLSGVAFAQILYSAGNGIFYDAQASSGHVFRIGAYGATTTSMTVVAGGVDLPTGKVLTVNAVPVVGARKTGWTVDTGTAKRTANATYSGTAEVGYTQATVQALMDAVRDLSQTVKALKDDLHGTAGHGLIGT